MNKEFKLIVGLGNIGEQFKNTRHNIGFAVIDFLCSKININISEFKNGFNGLFLQKNNFILFKPTTYMNSSGIAVQEITKFYKIKKENILIIYDDIYIPIGEIRLRISGNSGGHNGIKNIINCLGTNQIPRIKIGVGMCDGDLPNFVLKKLNQREIKILLDNFDNVTAIILNYIEFDFQHALTLFSQLQNNKKIAITDKNKVE